jgi:hypothetical protein
MDSRDSNYSINELTLNDLNTSFNLEDIKGITLKDACQYSKFDIISHEVLMFIIEKYQKIGLDLIIEMEKNSIIFPKQLKRILGK